jgi:hypothetical protein
MSVYCVHASLRIAQANPTQRTASSRLFCHWLPGSYMLTRGPTDGPRVLAALLQ